MNRFSLNSLSAWLKGGFNKWRLVFLAFAVVYAFFLLLDLSLSPIQWDEITHLNGGLLLLRGQYREYLDLSAFYPPLFDVVTTGFFSVAGVSVFSGRLVAVIFSLLSMWVVFEFAYRMYGPKIALISSILFGIMPGYFWLSRMTMIETMLVFFFTVSMLFFFNWLRNHQIWSLALSGVALGLGFLTKYQILVAGIIMIASILLLCRGHLKAKFLRFPLLILIVVAIAIPWINESYQIYTSKMLDKWMYALQVGNPEKLAYSTRFDLPVWLQVPMFYLIEMTWPYSDVHPISLFLYIFGLLGLGYFAWRRKPEDKFLLTWFFVVYIFFTLISNKHWRYVIPIFPVLAISAASLMLFAYNKLEKTWKSSQISVNKKRVVKVAAVFFTVTVAVSVFFSVSDAHYWVAKDQIEIPIEAATNYVATRLSENESLMVVCAFNLFSQDMVRFYLYADGTKHNPVWQYPELPVDTYTPTFDINEFIPLCEENNVKYVFTYEFGGDVPYFNTTLTLMDVYQKFYDSGRFAYLSGNASVEALIKDGSIPAFGTTPRRIIILTFVD
jgi:hypothetical protein